MRSRFVLLCAAGFACVGIAVASGPADRVPTDPQSVVSAHGQGTGAVSVDALLKTTHSGGFGVSPDGHLLAYTSDASGRPNLWVMHADGSGAHQLLQSNDRQGDATFSRDGSQILYTQDTGGDELYDIYAVSAAGGAPRNVTNTDDVSETSPEFSPDGAFVAFSRKPKASSITDIAVMAWPSGTVRALTHDSDPKAGWGVVRWSPDGRFLYAVRSVGIDDADVFRIDVRSGATEDLTAHTGKQINTSVG